MTGIYHEDIINVIFCVVLPGHKILIILNILYQSKIPKFHLIWKISPRIGQWNTKIHKTNIVNSSTVSVAMVTRLKITKICII